jgi:hypothetical protein
VDGYPVHLGVECASSTDACSVDGFGGFYDAQGNMDVVKVPDESSFLMLLLSEVVCLFCFAPRGSSDC